LKRILSAGFVLLLLTACAGVPREQPLARDQLEDFVLEARFSLRVSQPGKAPQSAGGRLSWQQKGAGGRILLSSPLGFALAEITSEPGHATLRTANGEVRESDNPERLIEDMTGQRLPVQRIPDWLLGRAGNQATMTHDPAGRPQQLDEAGWQVDYHYEDSAVDALPSRLTIKHGSDLELRLRIETWSVAR
jgi:outer membrane lipoprotein LolB